jgi:hypothetical protein
LALTALSGALSSDPPIPDGWGGEPAGEEA